MDFFEEIDLPGVGKKYVITTVDYEINVIIRESGNKELCFIKDEEVIFEVSLTDDESRKLGLILTEVFYKTVTKEKIEYVQKQLIFEWLKIPGDSIFIGKNLAELEVRKRTGVSIVAVIRGNDLFVNPDPYDFKFYEGDTLVCVGNRNQLKELENYMKNIK
ncbi:MAG: cation:proton antiporter regulatory subunit [bacterium]